jgi:hypothetical protein
MPADIAHCELSEARETFTVLTAISISLKGRRAQLLDYARP